MKRNSTVLLPLVLILVSLIWAGSFIVVQSATEEIDPIDLGFLRFLVATPIMVFILVLRGKNISIPAKELPSLVLLGLTGVTLLYLFQFIGINYTNAATAAVLINTNVLFIALLSSVFLKEILAPKKIIGISFSFGGVIIVIFSNVPQEKLLLNDIFFIGSVLILLSAFCWAVYSIVGKRLLEKYDPFAITTYAFALGTALYIPFIISDLTVTIQNVSFNGWTAIVYLALLCSVVGYLGWYYALKKTDASTAAVYLNFIPLFTITLSFFLGQIPTLFFLVGAILIIYGVYLTQRS
jgi:drug/metabolite transporter (DMT)-like permease